MHIEGMTISDVVEVMIHFKITARQFMLLMILETDKQEDQGLIPDDKKGAIRNVYRIAEEHVENWTVEDIDDLIKKELVFNHDTSGSRDIYPDNLTVSDIFCETVLSTMSDFEAFWKLYPGFVDNFDDFRKPKIPLKAADFQEVEALYKKYVRTKKKHIQVMEVLEWGIANDHVMMNIAKYVGSRMWDQHLELKLASRTRSPMSRTIV